jgi:hypothetical protein
MGHPSLIEYDNNWQISCQIWNKKGECHRDGNKPAFIEYNNNGQIKEQEWYQNGKIYKKEIFYY